jgi:D-beta-D-heptose 7-phosphate kinase/D-beta-D-heptose 1-phosphate adenosyltransferase
MENYRLKIKTLPEAKKEIEALKGEGRRIVFTNGVFDLLHPGHTRYLSAARELGDYLIVAVNSDKSVKAIKGLQRPILGQDERMELVAALSAVDAVVLFHEDNPLKVIEYLMPQVLVKGGDWSEDKIIGADAVKKAGGKVKRIPFASGYSSSTIIEKIQRLSGKPGKPAHDD